MTAFCTATENGEIRSFEDLKKRFALKNQDLFRYLQLREYYNKEMKRPAPEEMNPVMEVMVKAYTQKISRVISRLYHSIMECQKKSTLYIKHKWEKELNVIISEEEWYHMCETQQTSTNSLTWREFNWKNLTRFFITPNSKSKQLFKQQKCWRQCGEINANHTHVFWCCPKIETF